MPIPASTISCFRFFFKKSSRVSFFGSLVVVVDIIAGVEVDVVIGMVVGCTKKGLRRT